MTQIQRSYEAAELGRKYALLQDRLERQTRISRGAAIDHRHQDHETSMAVEAEIRLAMRKTRIAHDEAHAAAFPDHAVAPCSACRLS